MPDRFLGLMFRTIVWAAAGWAATACAARPAPSSRTYQLDAATPQTRPTEKAGGAGGGFSLTVYSTADPATFSPQDLLADEISGNNGVPAFYAPGFGVVREVRKMKLAAGVNFLEFTDVAAGIDPTTVGFRSLTAPDSTSVVEQNFEYDLTSADKLLQKHLGRQVILTVAQAAGAKTEPQAIHGELLSAAGGSYIVQTDDIRMPLVILNAQSVSSVRLANADTGLVSKPTLNWTVNAGKAGEHEVQVSYQTDGLTWRADYNLLVSPDEKTADLSAWVTLLNASGIGYPAARLKLVAGNVQRFISPERAQRMQGVVTNQLFAGNGQSPDTGFKEKGFFEYHMYTLGRTTTLPNNSTKQIELFPPRSGVSVGKVYVYYGLPPDLRYSVIASPQTDQNYGTESNKTVDIYVRFKDSAANHLGIPLPAGRMRVYKTDPADGSREFIGEDVIRHTPKDEQVMVRLGTAFDLVGERRQTDYHDTPTTATESFQIKLRNHKAGPVHVIVKENLYRWFNWEITQSSDKWEKMDYRTIQIPVDVPAGGEKTVTYTVKYSW